MTDAPRQGNRGSTDAAAGEVGTMFEILSMPQYIKAFAAKGITTLNSLLPAVDDPNCPEAFWLKLIPKPQDRSIVLGYLSIRRKKDPREVAKSEQRMHTFQLVKEALSELHDLQLRKAELERGSTVLNRKEATRQEIENLLDKIDDTKQKLESAQRDIQTGGGLADSSSRRTKPKIGSVRPSSGQPQRMGAPRSPRVANEGDDCRTQRAARPLLGNPPSARSHALPTASAPMSSHSHVNGGNAPSEQRPFSGTCFAGVSFDRPASASSSSRAAFATTCTFEENNRHRLADVGPGWNRNTPVPKMRHAADRLVLPVFGESSLSSRGGGRPLSATSVRSGALAGSDGMDHLDLRVQGKKATSVALGVHLENDHYAQMCCGASSRQL